MIEIVMEQEPNLKNLKQIGTPREENKIYIENLAYIKMREQKFPDKCLYVLMGHTERMEGRFATFVEAVIPVSDMEFSGNLPRWTNRQWSYVYKEIKRICEDMIIVGWAIDVKGMPQRITPELERMHREHFGGKYQVLMLMDSLEQTENFYMSRDNQLVAKDGFYIYYHAPRREAAVQAIKTEEKEEESFVELDIYRQPEVTGRYRKMMKDKKSEEESSGAGLAIAVAMLLFVLMVGVYENKESILGKEPVATEAGARPTEAEEPESEEKETDKIPIELVPGIK